MPVRLPELHMKTTATDKLTRAYLQKLSRQNYFATASTALIVTFSLLWMLFLLGGKEKTIYFADSMYAVATWIGSFWACRTAYRARYGPLRLEPRHQLAWLVIGTGLFTNGIGGAYYTYLEWSGKLNPVPSLADLGFTLFYLLTFIGLLLMPTAVKPRRSRIRIGLDAIITMLCILGISWYFVIWPIFAIARNQPALLVAASYPFWDILLILAILLLIYQRTEPILFSSLLLCGLGIVSLICADTGYALTLPFGIYTTGTPYIDTFWFTGALLIGLSAPLQYATIARRVYNERAHPGPEANGTEYPARLRDEKPQSHTRLLQSLLIYVSLIILLTLTLYSEFRQQHNVFLLSLTAIVGLLVTARYLLATNENEILLQEREQRREMAERLRMLSAQLTEELELDRLLTRIVTIATTSLGFDTAILMLIEEYEHPRDAQSSLLIRAASSTSAEVITWRFQGEHLPNQFVFAGKQIEMLRTEQTLDLPADINDWQKEQQILVTLFVPLTYQGKIQGSLGFSSRTSRHFSDRDMYLAKALTEEAAAAIEHAHLYEAAREHELFAQALANVAARLNAAAATGTRVGAEILQLICTEGANALQADYALLYVKGNNDQLLPVATFASERGLATSPNDWPPIRNSEFEAKALSLLHPVLVQIDNPSHSDKLPAITAQTLALPASPAGQDSSDTLPLRITTGGLRGRRTPTLREVLLRRNVQTAILTPLIARNTPVGLLILARSLHGGTQQKKAFAVADLPQAQDFAEQAAIAFTNAQLYQQLRNAHQQLQELDKLKDQFMITASHELRTPLTAVQGYLELLADYGESIPPNQRQEFLQKARRGCDELALLLSNIMDASRLEIEAGIRPALLGRVSVQEVVRGIIDLIEPQVTQEDREVHMYIPNKLFVKADPVRLRQILLNITVNALKYSKAGTPITFSARAVKDRIPGAIISISDKGKGIKPQDQARLFQRFVRLESDLNSTVRGSGLGLYISRRLIEAMDGKIWIESSGIPGAGSTFHIQLPLA
jgi:signal transduction histidine kinase